MRIAKLGLAFVSVFAVAADIPVTRSATPVEIEGEFKLKAGGLIDLALETMTFAGHMSHLGLFTCEGTFDAGTLNFNGRITDGRGYLGYVYMTLVPQTDGVYQATFFFFDQLSWFQNLRTVGSGVIRVDPDSMFTMEILGTSWRIPCPQNRCLG